MDKKALSQCNVESAFLYLLYRLFGIVGVKEQDVTGRNRVKKRRRIKRR